jgi:hypothetical protein
MTATAFLDACGFIPTAGGTATWTVSAAITGYQTPAAAGAVNAAVYSYRAQSSDLSQWEEGYGTYTASGTTLTRTVTANSLGTTAAVNFSAAPNVYITALSQDLTYKAPGTGAVTRLLNNKVSNWFDVRDFGAIGDNSTDNTSAFNSAIAAAATAGASGGQVSVFIPDGIYRVTSLNSIGANIALIGQSRGGTIVRTTSATADVLAPNGANVQIRSLTIDASVARTAGYFIKPTTSASRITLFDLNLVAPFCGIYVPNIALYTMRDIDISSTVTSTGNSIVVDNGFAIILDNVICRNSTCFAHVVINNVNDITLNNCQFVQSGSPLYIAPGSGQIVGCLLSNNSMFDAPQTNQGIRISPATGGTVGKVFINNGWINKVSGQSNVLITNAGGGTVSGVSITNCIFPGGGTDTAIDCSGVSNLHLSGNRIGAHATAISLANCTDAVVCGNILGPTDGYAANTTAISLSGTSDYCAINGNDLRGNTTAVSNSSSGTNNIIDGNVGYPTAAPSGITVGASPFTYTAGPSPETVYVNSGTVSLITVGGVGVLQSTNHAIALRPNQSMVVTYSSTPSMVKSVN